MKRIPIIIGLLIVCIGIWLLITPNIFVRQIVERLDDLGYDLQLHTRILTQPLPLSNPIAIIDIDDRSLLNEGRWPWPRSKVATLVDELKQQGAVVLAFDVFFPETQSNISEQILAVLQKKQLITPEMSLLLIEHKDLFDEDAILANSLSQNQVVLALSFLPNNLIANMLPPPLLTLSPQTVQDLSMYSATGYISNIPVLQQAAKNGGFVNIFADSDGIIRHAPLVIEYKDGVYPSLSLQAVLSFLGEPIELVTPVYHDQVELEGIKIGSQVIPTNEQGQVLIPFIGKSYTFPYYSATDVLHHRLPKDALLGKILFIGTSATGLGDLKATAIETPFPGVEIQATVAYGILMHNFSYKPAWTFGANLVFIIIFGLTAAFTFPYLGPRALGAITILFPLASILINNLVWEKTGLIISILLPVVLVLVNAIFNIIYGYLFETRKREQLKTMFGQYVPEKHIDEMLHSTGSYALHGEDRDMSVLFADIRNFTTISEGLSAAELVEMLNTFFTPMTETIFNHQGTIDKYVGDLIMAFWGAPLKDQDHATHAIESALEMQENVKKLRPLLAERKWPEINIGIGINSGVMSVGDMGSKYRRNYTVLGDAVNLASRVEGLTKFYGAEIVVTESTQLSQTAFIFRKLDLVRVKGKQTGVAIYEVLGKVEMLTPDLSKELEAYHQALAYYFSQQWGLAETLFLTLHQEHPNAKIYALYLKRVEEFKSQPPAADWDGVYIHKTK